MTDAHTPPYPPDVLLQHRAWVRALARSLVRDPAAADDLEQDTWVRALESMPRDARSPRAWLGTVLRNRFRDTLRTRTRRTGRELAVARDGEQPAAADIAATAELHRGVLDAVLALEPTFRDVVLLRYFEGLTPAEIAERQGIPATTARTRLHRGLGRLRSSLDAEHGGDGDRWKRALLPLTAIGDAGGQSIAAPRKPWTVPTAVGVGAAIVAVGLLAVIAINGLRGGGAPRRPAVAVATGSAVTFEEDPIDAALRRERERVTAPFSSREGADSATVVDDDEPVAPAAEDAGPRIRVSVVDAAGTPVVGASVEIMSGDSFAKSGYARVVASASTGDDGAATLGAPALEEVRVIARRGDRAAVTAVLSRDDAMANDQRLTLGAASALRGRLVTPDGTGIPGARMALTLTGDVFGPGGLVFSDKEGRFAFPLLPHDAFETPANIEILVDGFPYTNQPATRADITGPGMRIVLTPAVTLTGRCIDAEGNPIAEVWVSCSHAVSPDETRADGRFRISGIDAARADDRPISVNVECDSHAPRRIEIDDDTLSTGDIGDVVLDVGTTLRGRVLGPDGRPAVNASVFAEGLDTKQISRQGQTDAEGRFVFEHVADEAHEIVASGHSDDAFSGLTGVAKDVQPGEVEVIVTLSTAMTVLVELIDAETSKPLTLTNVLVFIEPLDGDEDDEAGSGVSSEDGFRSVRIRAQRAGPYKLTVRSFDGWGEFVVERIDVLEHRETRVKAQLRRE